MTHLSQDGFRHRTNEDGTVDSICVKCFETVATKTDEGELTEAERNHTCQRWKLERSEWIYEDAKHLG